MKISTNNYLLAAVSFMSLTSCGEGEEPKIDCSVSGFSVTATVTNTETCSSAGAFTASSLGGVGNIEYSIDGSSFQVASTFDNLSSGNYTLTGKDDNGCTASTSLIIESDVSTISLSVEKQNSGCGTSNGSIEITASGGEGSYSYKIGEGGFSSSNKFSSLSSGNHNVIVKDANGCQITETISLLSGISYASSVKSIIDSNCATSGCHVSGTGRQNFTIFATVQSNAASIKTRTQNGSMPQTGSITADQKALIACWVDDGAPNN